MSCLHSRCVFCSSTFTCCKGSRKATEVLVYLERSYAALTKADGGKENGIVDAVDLTVAADGRQGTPQMALSDWPKKSARRPPTEIAPDEVRGALNLYKAKLSLMSRSSKSSKREIKTVLNSCTQNTTGLFLKSNLEYLRSNFRKAIKLLNNSCQKHERDANLAALYFNNMGCIHHCMRRHNAAAFYFQRALLENDRLYKKTPSESIPLSTFSCDRRCEIEYNRALQLLFGGRPAEAFASFRTALLLLHKQPRIWLRMGEACVAQHMLIIQQKTSEKHAKQLSPLVGVSAGVGENRRLVLPIDDEGEGVDNTEARAAAADVLTASDMTDDVIPSLAFGIKCLRNALQLCEAQLGSIAWGDYATLQLAVSQATPSASEDLALHLHIVLRLALLQLAWCGLLRGDYVQALHCSTQLLTDDCPPSLKLHAHLYTADAMCHLNRSTEALEHLLQAMQLGELSIVANSNIEGTTSDSDLDAVRNPYTLVWGVATATQDQQPASKPTGAVATRAVLYANLATVYVLRDDVKEAMEHVQQALSIQPDCRQALLCLIFLELKAGKVDRAVDILKKQRPRSACK